MGFRFCLNRSASAWNSGRLFTWALEVVVLVSKSFKRNANMMLHPGKEGSGL